MKLLKVLENDMCSPYQKFQFELGKLYHCDTFDESNKEYPDGFYAVDYNGLSYAYRKGTSIYKVEVSGRQKEFNPFKRRYENIEIIRKLEIDEIKAGLLKANETEGYNVYESVFPVNPFEIEPVMSIDRAVELMQQWASVVESIRDSVGDSVGDSVWDSVWASVWDSVWDSVWASVGAFVRDSVWDYFWAYLSSLFPNIKKWKYIEHEGGENPFQPAIDLWKAGYVSSFDSKTWRLHTKNGIVYEVKR